MKRIAPILLSVVAGALWMVSPASAERPPLFWQAPEDGARGTAAGRLTDPGGAATDPDSGHVFVADRTRVDEFDAYGQFVKTWGWGVVASGPDDEAPKNERQEVAIGAAAGTFALDFLNTAGDGNSFQQVTTPISFDAPAATVQGALEALPSIGDGGVSVHGPNGGPWTVEFIASLADTEILPLKIVESKLSGGTETAAVNAIQDGGSFEVCTPAKGDICEAGQAGYRAGEIFHPQGIAIDAAGNVYVDEPTTGGAGEEPSYRVQKFDSEGRFLLMLGGEVNKTTGEDVCTVAQQEGGMCVEWAFPGKTRPASNPHPVGVPRSPSGPKATSLPATSNGFSSSTPAVPSRTKSKSRARRSSHWQWTAAATST